MSRLTILQQANSRQSKKKTLSSRGRPWLGLRRWLRHSWISRLSLTDWCSQVRHWLRPANESGRIFVRPFRPDFTQLEDRFMPNDPFGLMQTALLGPAFSLLTPSAVLFHGWSSNTDQADAGAVRVSGSTSTPTAPSDDRWMELLPYQERPRFEDPHTPHGGWNHAGIYPEEGPIIPPSTMASGSSGALENPLGSDWLGAVSAALGSAEAHSPSAGQGSASQTRLANGSSFANGGLGAPGGSPGGGALASPVSFLNSSPALNAANLFAMASAPSVGRSLSGLSGSSFVAAPASGTVTPLSSPAGDDQPPTRSTMPPTLQPNLGTLPLAFEANVGQTDPQVQYLSHGPGFELFLTGNAAFLSLTRPSDTPSPITITQDVISLQFTGASATPQIATARELPNRSNYFIGSDPSAWLADVTQFGQVSYKDLYPGIDLNYYGNGHQLEYDFVVAPGADPNQILLNWQGLTGLSTDQQGNSVLQTAGGSLVEQAPVIYQIVDGVRQTVSGQLVSQSVNQLDQSSYQLGFQVGSYDHTLPLYIDPVVNYATYLGGSGSDNGTAIAVDLTGNAYITGNTTSTNFPGTTGSFQSTNGGGQDGFITKLNSDGSAIVYSTYLGGSSTDGPTTILIDATGDAYIAGLTNSTNFPTTAGAYQTSLIMANNSSFLTKLNATGDGLSFSTLFHSSVGPTSVNGLAINSLGNAYLTGITTSGLPFTAGAFQTSYGGGPSDGFVTEFNTSGTGLVYSSYLGGSSNDVGYGIALDASGNAFVTGNTFSTNFPFTTGAYQTSAPGNGDAFVTEINAAGSATVYSTYLGGASGSETGYAIALDLAGNAYITGSTASSNFPTTAGAYQTTQPGGGGDAFVTKLNSAGTALTYSTYLGGASGIDTAKAIAVDANGYAYITGATASTNFPTTNALYSTNAGGANDTFVTRLLPAGTGLDYSTYLGGSSDDQGQGIAIDIFGTAYVTGQTNSTNFPTINAVQPSGGVGTSTYDAFVASINLKPAAPVFTSITTDSGASSTDQTTTDQTLILSGTAPNSSSVSIYRSGVGLLGTTTASAGGAWSYDYTATTLPEGTADFTATAAVGGLTSALSKDFLVKVDLTAPTLAVIAPAQTTSFGPVVQVNASDLGGLAANAAVTVDVDKNNDGDFLDAGESGYASGTLKDGTVSITLPTLPGTGTYPMRVRVTDLAGNQATSATQNIVVNAVGSAWTLTGQEIAADPLSGDALNFEGNAHLEAPINLSQSSDGSAYHQTRLVYNSDTVTVMPIIQGILQADNAVALPPSITAQLTWNGTVVATQTYTITGNKGDLLTFALQVPSANAPTASGRYPWVLKATMNYGTAIVKTLSGAAYVDVQNSSALGAGWSLSEVDQLTTIAVDNVNGYPAGVLRTFGTGGWRFYTDTGGGTYSSPAGDNGTLSLSGGVYTYQTPDGQKWLFNSSGQETSMVSADGQATTSYRYTGTQLTGRTDVDGALATFTYSSGQVKIATVNSRTTTVALDVTTNKLTQITNPDGGVHTFAYDTNKRLTGETFANTQHGWAYAASGTLNTMTLGSSTSPTVSVLSPAGVQGLGSTLVVGSALAKLTDPLNHITYEGLDAHGRPTLAIAADGGQTQFVRDANGYISSSTDPLNRTTTLVRDAQGYVTLQTLPDGNTDSYAYQAGFHALTTFTNERSYTTTYAYDGSGHPVSQTDAQHHTTTYGWTGSGLLQTVTDPLGHTVTYAYDADRRQISTTNALGFITTVAYDANGTPSTTTDALLHVSTTVYDVMGRLVNTVDAVGDKTTSTYNAAGLQLTQQDPLGHQTSLIYDSFQRGLVATTLAAVGTAVPQSALSSFDAAGNISASRNANGWWTNTAFDPTGRPNQSTNAYGGLALSVYDLAGQATASRDEVGRLSKSQYNSRGWVTQTADALGNLTTSTFDAAGNRTAVTDPLNHTTTYVYDELNRQTATVDALGNRTTTTFDAAGKVASVQDARGDTTTYSYDAANRRVAVTEAAGTAVQRTMTTVYDKAGNTIASIDALNRTTTYIFDNANRQIAVKDAQGNLTTTTLDAVGNAVAGKDALNHTTTYSFDALNRQIATTDPLNQTTTTTLDALGQTAGTTDALRHASVTGYDRLGRGALGAATPGSTTQAVTQAVFDAAGNALTQFDALGNATQNLYDGANRVVQSTDPLGHVVTTVYDAAGNVSRRIDACGFTTTYSYDALNRQTSVQSPSGGITTTVYDQVGNQVNTIDPLANKTTFVFDALNRQTQVIDARTGTTTTVFDAADNTVNIIDPVGNKTTMVYDSLNREIQTTDPLGHSGTMAYDAASRLASQTDRDGRRRDFTYDNANRETKETWVVSGSTVNTLTYTYDAANNKVTAADQNGAYTCTYDSLNRLATQKDVFGLTLTFTYDANGNRTNVQDSLGGVTTSVYDAANRLTSRQFGGAGLATLTLDLTYTSRDQIATETRYSNLNRTGLVGTTSMSYDPAMRETNLQFKDASGTNISNLTYTYDLADRLTSETLNGTTVSYQYDTTNQLTQAGTATYGYDLNGNRTNTGYATGTGNQLLNDGTWIYTYDNEGNLTKKSKGALAETWVYGYDNRNQMTSAVDQATDGGTVIQRLDFKYDVLEDRIEKKVTINSTATTTHFAYDGPNAWADLDGNNGNAPLMRRLYLDGVDQMVARSAGTTAAWYLTDRLGSVRDIANNSTGVSIDHLDYDGFGTAAESTPANGDRYKYTAREFDGESGLQYNRARYYDPKSGRWTNEDPLGFEAGDGNLYRYCLNSPPHCSDPSGLAAIVTDVSINDEQDQMVLGHKLGVNTGSDSFAYGFSVFIQANITHPTRDISAVDVHQLIWTLYRYTVGKTVYWLVTDKDSNDRVIFDDKEGQKQLAKWKKSVDAWDLDLREDSTKVDRLTAYDLLYLTPYPSKTWTHGKNDAEWADAPGVHAEKGKDLKKFNGAKIEQWFYVLVAAKGHDGHTIGAELKHYQKGVFKNGKSSLDGAIGDKGVNSTQKRNNIDLGTFTFQSNRSKPPSR
ncbi:MAG: SBBP repeat-containing protein [Gemmataceae bacterium]